MKEQSNLDKLKQAISITLKNEGIQAFDIYLFGSRARCDFSAKSDYDILIVSYKKLGMKRKIKLFSLLRRMLARKRFNVDIIIKSTDEVNYYKNKTGHIVRSALKEGILI